MQRWALETVKSLDPVDYLTYDELEEVISWIMGVLNFDLFQEPLTEGTTECFSIHFGGSS